MVQKMPLWALLEFTMSLLLVSLRNVRAEAGRRNLIWSYVFGSDEDSQTATMTRGASRRVSIVSPKETDDDSLAAGSKSKSSSKTDDDSSTSTKQAPKQGASSSGGSSSSSSSSGSSSTSSSSASTPSSASTTNTTSTAPSTSNTTVPSPTNSTSTTTAMTTKSTSNSTQASKPKVTDPGEQHTNYKRPLPVSYIYGDDDNAQKIEFNSPLNPVVDDIAQFLDDNIYSNKTHSVLPPEKEPPTSWPIDVFGIFLGAALLLFVATAYKNYKKRKAYTPVPSS